MTKPCGDPDFLQEPIAPDQGGEFRPQDLDRDLAIVLQVLGHEDGSHATLSQLPLDVVAVREGGREAIVEGQVSRSKVEGLRSKVVGLRSKVVSRES